MWEALIYRQSEVWIKIWAYYWHSELEGAVGQKHGNRPVAAVCVFQEMEQSCKTDP